MESTASTPKTRYASLLFFCGATVLSVSLEQYAFGGALWIASLYYALVDSDPRIRRRMAVLLGCVGLLTAAPIHTDTSTAHVLRIGAFFLAVVALPALILRWSDPGVIRYRFWPRKFRWVDLVYVLISIPLAKWVIQGYFHFSPEVPTHWTLPAQFDGGEVWRLFWGINGVGVWDELFFVNTVYAVLRSMFSFRIANLVQAVVYTAVLYDMAFTGIGPAVVYLFALTQGAMFEESENLLYVLIVHLIVDYFLFSAIVQFHYPAETMGGFLFH